MPPYHVVRKVKLVSESEVEPLLTFPCRYPIKAFGKAEADFVAIVLNIVTNHADTIYHEDTQTRASHGGKYTAVTLYIEATSREQVTAISADLVAHPKVIMAL